MKRWEQGDPGKLLIKSYTFTFLVSSSTHVCGQLVLQFLAQIVTPNFSAHELLLKEDVGMEL